MANRETFRDALQQQRLPSYTPPPCSQICMLAFTFALGIFCLAIGIAFTKAASAIQVERYSYAHLAVHKKHNITLNLTGFKSDKVLIYYELEGFNQLHYSMRHAYDYKHFADANYSYACTGETEFSRDVHKYLDEIIEDNTSWWPVKIVALAYSAIYLPPRALDFRLADENRKPGIPCGQRARFFFNDTIRIFKENNELVPFHNKGISYKGDKDLFKNPGNENPCSPSNCKKLGQCPKTKRWGPHICDMEDGMQNEDFMVWMKPAFATKFVKPWKILNTSHPDYKEGLSSGMYRIELGNNWWPWFNHTTGQQLLIPNGTAFNKTIVITTLNWAGGKRNFLGIAYTIVGVIILFVACGLVFIQSFYPHHRHQETDDFRWRKNI